MAISSMTGFARDDGSSADIAWTWELRSVNGRGLDIRMRLPPGFEEIEAAARETIAKPLSRGNLTVTLAIEKGAEAGRLKLNEAVLRDVLQAADKVIEIAGGSRPTPAELLNIRGVLESGDRSAANDPAAMAAREARNRALLDSLATAVAQLCAARRGEGARLEAAVAASIDDMARITADVRNNPARSPRAIEARLGELVQRLLAQSEALDRERLHQEAVIVATRADVEEELIRLDAHCAAARDLLASDGAVGRKLDFLAQEFNREANTLCSKAASVEISRLGLALKSVVDQFREQIQNIE